MDIQVYCVHSRMVDIEAMVENPRNPNKHSDKQISLLAKIIKSQGWRNPIVVSNRSGFIVKGHCRLAAARLLGVESVPVDYQDYETEAAEWADMIADNRIAELAVSDDKELRALLSELEGQIDLELTGFSGVSLEDLLSEPEVIDEEAEAEKVKMQKLELSERMDKAKYVFWAFSGGRDSTRALIATWEAFAATGKHCEVIYIENTCEFPDLIMHIKRVCKMLGAKLTTVHPSKTYLTEYFEKGKSPDSLYMDCVEKLINEPMDKYIESVVGSEDYILVRGGQPKQKTSRSGTAEMQAIKSKPNMIIYNPAFSMTKEQLEATIPEWPGYAAGFKRTACWCCPFQCREQYDALRLNYPLLFEEMKRIMGSIRIKTYRVKSYDEKIQILGKGRSEAVMGPQSQEAGGLVLVSACLLGERCRWHGRIHNSSAARKLIGDSPFIMACPELLGGLSCPRTPVKRRGGRVFETCEDKAERRHVTGTERTEEFMLGAQKTLAICQKHGIRKAILAKYSPSCDCRGITGKLLQENGIEVINVF